MSTTLVYSSEQDKTIAKVALAGWQIEELHGRDSSLIYTLRNPGGHTTKRFYSTRYTAALAAETYIIEESNGLSD